MKKTLFLMAAAALTLAACNRISDNSRDFSSMAITVEPILTRATETNFEAGDAIGLTVSREAGVYADNAKLTFDGSAFKGELTWYAEGADVATFAAYYPYSATKPATFTVQADQSAGLSASDFISCVKEDVVPTPGTVTMNFKHRLARLALQVTNNYGAAIDAFTVKGAIPTAIIADDLTATVDETADAANIKAFKNGDSWYAILPAQTVALTIAATAGDVTLEQRLASATLAPGKSYIANVVVNPDDLQVVISGEIDGWDNGGELEPGGDEPVQFEENLEEGYFTYDNVRYNIVKLDDNRYWMAQPLAFVPKGKTVSSDPAEDSGIWFTMKPNDDGTAVVPATDASNGYLYNTPTALGVEITAENYNTLEGVQGICPDGWHIPTRAEFIALVGSSVKGANDAAAITDDTAAYFDSAYNGGKITTLDADGFNYAFTGVRLKGSNTATGSYNTLSITSAQSTVDAYQGKARMNYMISSTGNSATATNFQFFGLMSTFTNTYPEGRLNVSFNNYLNGCEVRCVRNK